MVLEFDCSCGKRLTESTSGKGGEVHGVQVVCPDCNANYIVTITQLAEGAE